MACGVLNCKFDKFTPGGSMNFACKFWKQKAAKESESIREKIDGDSDLEIKATRQQFSFEKFQRERIEICQEIKPLSQATQEYPPESVEVLQEETEALKSRLKSAYQEIDKINKEPISFKPATQAKVEEFQNQLSGLDDIPMLFDPRAQQVLTRHAKALGLIISAIFNKPIDENPDIDYGDNKTTPEVKDKKGDLPINKLLEINNFVEVFSDTFSVIDKILKILKNLIVVTQGVMVNDHKHKTLSEVLRDKTAILHMTKYSRYLKFKLSKEEDKKINKFYICSKEEALRLIGIYPNLYYLHPKLDFDGFSDYEKFHQQFPNGNFTRIVLIPDYKYIPPNIINEKKIKVYKEEYYDRPFIDNNDDHNIVVERLYCEVDVFLDCINNRPEDLQYSLVNELHDSNNFCDIIISGYRNNFTNFDESQYTNLYFLENSK